MGSEFPEVLSSLRRERGLNQRQVASELGISQALLSHYENGLREPRLDFVVKVCDYYGVSADYMLGRTDKKTSGEKLEKVASELRRLAELADRLVEEDKRHKA